MPTEYRLLALMQADNWQTGAPPDEDAAYKEFVKAVDVISIIQAKARKFLANHPAGLSV